VTDVSLFFALLTIHAARMDFDVIITALSFTISPEMLCTNITIQNDLVVEEQLEQFVVMLSSSDMAVQFSQESASVLITDNDSMCCYGGIHLLAFTLVYTSK